MSTYLEDFDYLESKINESDLDDELKEILNHMLWLINTRSGE